MKVLGIILTIGFLAFLIWQLYLLIRDIKYKTKNKKNVNKDNNNNKEANDTSALTSKED